MPEPDAVGPRAVARVAAGLLMAATATTVGAACAGPERSEAPVAEDVYVEVMSRLAAIHAAADSGRVAEPLSGARADSLRSEVLRDHGVTRSELKAFARVVGDEPRRMKALWERIGAATDSLSEAGWPVDTAAAAGDSLPGADSVRGDDSLPGDDSPTDEASPGPPRPVLDPPDQPITDMPPGARRIDTVPPDEEEQ